MKMAKFTSDEIPDPAKGRFGISTVSISSA